MSHVLNAINPLSEVCIYLIGAVLMMKGEGALMRIGWIVLGG